MYEIKPWLKFYEGVPESIPYPRVSMFEALLHSVEKNADSIAYDFMDTTATYRAFADEIEKFASALDHLGLKKGDCITISMPTSPQGVICFYAANKLGAVTSMIHPLSTPSEIEFYLTLSKSTHALTLNAFYGKFSKILDRTAVKTLILTGIEDYLSPVKRFGFYLTKGRKIPPVPKDPRVRWWKELMAKDYAIVPTADVDTDDLASILYSGGTTGVPKGIMLSNMNLISEGMQVAHWGKLSSSDSILAVLPIFHGFGLAVCINAIFMGGATSILVPSFTPETVAKLVKKKKPSLMVGIPTLYEALNGNRDFQRTDLSCLKTAFSGADTLPRLTKDTFEEIVRRQGGNVRLLEGYGLTEAVTAIMAMPLNNYREGSVGVPLSDTMAKVVRQGTTDEALPGEDGELCIHGPTVMLGYLNQPEETANTLRQHADGKIWLHTGDIASMDENGFFYFKLRLKRMIKSSGMNVYPTQVEAVLCKHPAVVRACVIGIPDRAQVERVKAFVILNDPSQAGATMEKMLIDHCREILIKWSCPREIEFRDTLPMTPVGKIDYKVLENEEIAKIRATGEYTGR